MFIGHISAAVAVKPIVPKINVWLLILAAQLLDLLCLILVIFGIEGLHPDARPFEYGGIIGHIPYSHALLTAILLSVFTFLIINTITHRIKVAWVFAGLVFSHWILDLIVHHPDMPFLPGNLGDFRLLGLGLWSKPWIALAVEVLMGVIALFFLHRWVRVEGDKKGDMKPVVGFLVFLLVTTVFHVFQMPS
jgi:lysylphosphatidylglycerol synthetase-like protein (DUF2156 family)